MRGTNLLALAQCGTALNLGATDQTAASSIRLYSPYGGVLPSFPPPTRRWMRPPRHTFFRHGERGRCRLERSKGGCLPLRVRELTRAALPETRDGKPQEQSSSRASGGRARGEFSRSATSLRGPSGAAIRHRGSEVLSPQGHANLGRSTHANVGVQRPGG